MAPEISLRKARDLKAIDHKACDMWSLGITIYRSLTYDFIVEWPPSIDNAEYIKIHWNFLKDLQE